MPPRKFTTSTANRKSRQSEITGLPFVKRRAKRKDTKDKVSSSPHPSPATISNDYHPSDEEREQEEDEDLLLGRTSTPQDTHIDDDFARRKQRKPKARPRPIAIHQEHLSEVDKLLRQFDLNYTYGPCVGLTRLERWERAQALGLNPPQSVKDILLKDGGENQESLFHGQI